jgi:hypothetical protein
MGRLAIIVVLGAGCSVAGSDDIETRDIRALMDVDVDSVSTDYGLGPGGITVGHSVHSWINVGLYRDLDEVRLDDGDALTFTVDERPERPLGSDDDFPGLYTFDATGETGWSELTIALARDAHAPAPSSHVRAPSPLAFTETTTVASYFDDTIALSWSNPNPDGTITVSATGCDGLPKGVLSFVGITIDDTGHLELAAADLLAEAPPKDGVCVSLVLQREAEGKVDPALDPDSYLRARRSEDIAVLVTQ